MNRYLESFFASIKNNTVTPHWHIRQEISCPKLHTVHTNYKKYDSEEIVRYKGGVKVLQESELIFSHMIANYVIKIGLNRKHILNRNLEQAWQK